MRAPRVTIQTTGELTLQVSMVSIVALPGEESRKAGRQASEQLSGKPAARSYYSVTLEACQLILARIFISLCQPMAEDAN